MVTVMVTLFAIVVVGYVAGIISYWALRTYVFAL